MNLTAIRQKVKRNAILDDITQNRFNLFLPDQDVLNALYGHLTLQIPDELYNYDVRAIMFFITLEVRESGI